MEALAKAAESFVPLLDKLGSTGIVIVSVLVGLAIAVVLVAHFSGLYQGRREDGQRLDIVDRLIADVDKLLAREARLRADLEQQERESDSHRIRAAELQADAELMRVQLRRYIELIRAVKDGRLLPSAITEADIAEALK